MFSAIISYHGARPALFLALLVPIAIALFSSKRPYEAATLVYLGCAAFAPVGVFIKFPLLPELDKSTMAAVAIIIGALASRMKSFLRHGPGRGAEAIVLISMLGGVMTAQTNGDPLTYGSFSTVVLPGLGIKDGLYLSFVALFTTGLPFMVGRLFVRGREGLMFLCKAWVGIALVLVPLITIELRLSPQVHTWVYGYPPHHDFLQTIRWGGYRPMVLMQHGLALALFMLNAVLISAALYKSKVKLRLPGKLKMKPKTIVGLLVVIMILCKSTGAIVYLVVLLPLVLFASAKAQARTALVIALVAFSYPALQAFSLVPTEKIVDLAGNISAERAASLDFRFRNEEQLLEKARERVWYGWGAYTRNQVFDFVMGKPISVTDGYWIILLGIRGIVGLIAGFGMLIYPIVVHRKKFARIKDPKDRRLMLSLALVLAISTFDLIPNGLFSTYPYFLAGALSALGRDLDPRKTR